MSDGAHLGLDADTSMRAVLGDPGVIEHAATRDPVAMRTYLESFPVDAVPKTYEEAGAIAGHMILQFLLADPRRAQIPTENEYETRADGKWTGVVITKGLYRVMKDAGIPIDRLGLSGFQWGWAVNAARYCVELGPVANPAILTIEVPE